MDPRGICNKGAELVSVAAARSFRFDWEKLSPSTLSPFRYPGGKSWLRPTIFAWLAWQRLRPKAFLEPFAGGASVGLAVAELDLAEHVIFVERDPSVAAVWRAFLGRNYRRMDALIRDFVPTRRAVQRVLARSPGDDVELAFQVLVRNRTTRAGIIAPGAGLLNKGENGRGIASRWYPQTLRKRGEAIRALRRRFTFIEGNGFEEIIRSRDDTRTAVFADPPYLGGVSSPGSRLYAHSDVRAEDLILELAQRRGPFALTYHAEPFIADLAHRHELTAALIRMRDAHHRSQGEWLILNRS